jgi:hypothetical protein
MIKNSILIGLLLVTTYLPAIIPKSQNSNPFVGKWTDVEKAAKVIEIYLAKDGLYYGKVIKTDEPTKAPIGSVLYKQCKYDVKNQTLTGFLTPSDADFKIDATFQIEKDGKLKISAKKFFISKTFFFKKVK